MNENGKFTNRTQLKKVPRLGPKAYEQAVGFLRIIDGTNPFDGTDIHPESYDVAKAILKKANAEKLALGSPELEEALKGLNTERVERRIWYRTRNAGISAGWIIETRT